MESYSVQDCMISPDFNIWESVILTYDNSTSSLTQNCAGGSCTNTSVSGNQMVFSLDKQEIVSFGLSNTKPDTVLTATIVPTTNLLCFLDDPSLY